MCTKTELKGFLEQISEAAEFTRFEYKSRESFKVNIVCKVAENQTVDYYDSFAKDWMDKFSLFTNSEWIVRNCFPIQRMLYRRTYRCHLSSKNKRVGSSSARNLECRATINFKAKFINKNTATNELYLQNGLNMNILVDYDHSHLVNDTVCFNLLKSSSRTNAIFSKYFKDGYTAPTAKCYHELRLIEKYGEDSDQLQNGNINPSLQHIKYLYNKQPRLRKDEHKLMLRRFKRLEKAGYTVKYSYDPRVVVIVTPLMKRVILQMSVKEVLVDATRVYRTPFTMFLYVPSKIGSLPIACVIYDKLSEANYSRIFFTIKLALESECKVHFEPKLLLVGDKQAQDALTYMFPNAVIKYNRFSLCRKIWEWISDGDNSIETNHDVMGLFKTLIYATSMEDAERIYGSLRTTTSMKSCLGKLEEIWENRYQWIGNEQCKGFSEAPLAFMREVILQRCNSFNICEMIDFVTIILERHYKKIIKSHIDGGVTAMYTKFLQKTNIGSHPEFFKKIDPNQYKYRNVLDKYYCEINIDTMCCDCEKGVKGRLCEHLCGVLNYIHESLVPLLSEKEKAMFLRLVDIDSVMNNEHEFEELNEMPGANDDTSVLLSSEASDDSNFLETKTEVTEDPLGGNIEIDTSEDVKEDMKIQYEAAMKSVNDEFRRINKLFRENPNRANLETMSRLARELGKIRPVEKVDFSKMFIKLNRTHES